jgi:uncharacterized metal-binding protein YceD (DUF177 family)
MGRRDYEIAFVGLKQGLHEFEYEINDQFFEVYQQQDFQNCRARVKLILEKHSSFMVLTFEVSGGLEVICDRCGNNLPLQLWDEFKLVVKLVDNPEEMNNDEGDPDVYYIARTESHLHVQNWVYEFINLSIPMQKMCNESEMGGPQCNLETLEMLKKMNHENKPAATGIWKGLDKIKGLDN